MNVNVRILSTFLRIYNILDTYIKQIHTMLMLLSVDASDNVISVQQ